MMIISGQGNYGKVDVVPGFCYVATRFFHLYYVPLIPLGSYVIKAGTEDGDRFEGVKTTFSFRSVLAAWVRTVLVLSLLAGVGTGIVMGFEHLEKPAGVKPSALIVPWALAVCSCVAYWITVRSARAGYGRAVAMAAEMGFPPETVDRYFPPESWEGEIVG